MRLMGVQAIRALLLLVFVSAALLSCAKQPTPEECKTAIVHMMEVQLDETQQQVGQGQLAEQSREGVKWLKSQIPLQVTPEVVSQCVERMKRDDIQCTMSATTTKELVENCHWKIVNGPKGAALGF